MLVWPLGDLTFKPVEAPYVLVVVYKLTCSFTEQHGDGNAPRCDPANPKSCLTYVYVLESGTMVCALSCATWQFHNCRKAASVSCCIMLKRGWLYAAGIFHSKAASVYAYLKVLFMHISNALGMLIGCRHDRSERAAATS